MDGVTAAAPAASAPDFWILMIKTLGALCFVLAVLMGALYLLKRLTRPQEARQKGMIRLLSTFYLAPKERLHLMEVMGRKILIAVSAQGITRITEFGDHEEAWDETTGEESPAVQNSLFRNLLARLTGEPPAREGKTTPAEQGQPLLPNDADEQGKP